MELFAPVNIWGIGLEFFLFGLTLVGVALFHHKTMEVALTGMVAIVIYKTVFTSFGLVGHLHHEWKDLLNLFGLLIGFAILADHFEHSGIPAGLPKYLPDNWTGGFALLVIVFMLSALLDNIAATMIGGGIAHVVYRRKLHLAFLAAIVAASNAGGSGSVLGDTTTTMMWIDGVNLFDVLHAYVAAVPALILVGIPASIQQHRYNPIMKDEVRNVHISQRRVLVCVLMLLGAVGANILLDFPAIGVWLAIFIGSFIITTHWKVIRHAMSGTIFLLALVLSASMMPVDKLPEASWHTTLGLGFLSSVFDNIPLTKLALVQGGYDWGILAFAVGFGGSMIWFGSSAGVALSNMFPEAKSIVAWVKNAWYIIPAYVISYFIMLQIMGWNPHAPHKEPKLDIQEIMMDKH
ncbi:MAG: citrate transporter [Bacteroidetes bacterium]|nr:citrate transporter [Bacteroidota bacterium]